MPGTSRRSTTDARLQVAQAADASGTATSPFRCTPRQRQVSRPTSTCNCAAPMRSHAAARSARPSVAVGQAAYNPSQPDLARALALIDLVAGSRRRRSRARQVLAANPADARALVDKGVALDLQGQHRRPRRSISRCWRSARRCCREERPRRVADAGGEDAAGTGYARADAGRRGSPPRLKTNLGLLYAATGNVDGHDNCWGTAFQRRTSRR